MLDPLLRRLTAETPGVELLTGHTATGLLDGGRAASWSRTARTRGASCARGSSSPPTGATRGSRGWPACPGACGPHNRFFYWAYWRGVQPAGDRSRMWFMEPDCAYTFPNEDGLCLVLVAPHRDRLPEFRADLEGAYLRYLEALPDAPDLSDATRESKLLGKLDLPNV